MIGWGPNFFSNFTHDIFHRPKIINHPKITDWGRAGYDRVGSDRVL